MPHIRLVLKHWEAGEFLSELCLSGPLQGSWAQGCRALVLPRSGRPGARAEDAAGSGLSGPRGGWVGHGKGAW